MDFLFEVLWHPIVHISSMFLNFIVVYFIGTILGLGIAYVAVLLLDYYVYETFSIPAVTHNHVTVGRSNYNRWTLLAYPELSEPQYKS
jgi:hypothetical protein